ncbi:MAG TPA: hypothetical protein VH933_14705 [Aestuariivirgaceae bacterium]|jgi:hypothetical protein
MAFIVAPSENVDRPRAGLTSLAAETRQIVDRHHEVQARTSRKLSWFAVGLVVAMALILVLLTAATALA